MALVVEDGTGLANATSFVARSDYIAYAAARGVVVADEDASDIELVKAIDFLMTKCWKGTPTVDGQALPFPRHVENFDGTLAYPDDAVPTPIKRAQMDAALAVRSGFDLMPVVAGGSVVKREKLGPIETEYEEGSAYNTTTLPTVAAAIAPYECGQGAGFRTVRV